MNLNELGGKILLDDCKDTAREMVEAYAQGLNLRIRLGKEGRKGKSIWKIPDDHWSKAVVRWNEEVPGRRTDFAEKADREEYAEQVINEVEGSVSDWNIFAQAEPRIFDFASGTQQMLHQTGMYRNILS